MKPYKAKDGAWIATLSQIFQQLPQDKKKKPVRAVAIITIGEHGEFDLARSGMTEDQFWGLIMHIGTEKGLLEKIPPVH